MISFVISFSFCTCGIPLLKQIQVPLMAISLKGRPPLARLRETPSHGELIVGLFEGHERSLFTTGTFLSLYDPIRLQL
jgi:hypothetical protein